MHPMGEGKNATPVGAIAGHDVDSLLAERATVLPRKILGGDERDLRKLGFSLGPEIDEHFRRCEPPPGWEMRRGAADHWLHVVDETGYERLAVFVRDTGQERLAHLMVMADKGALA